MTKKIVTPKGCNSEALQRKIVYRIQMIAVIYYIHKRDGFIGAQKIHFSQIYFMLIFGGMNYGKRSFS